MLISPRLGASGFGGCFPSTRLVCLLANSDKGIDSCQTTVALFGRCFASSAAHGFQFRITTVALCRPSIPKGSDIRMMMVNVGEAVLFQVTQYHTGVIADTHIPARIDGEVRSFACLRAPAKMDLFVLPRVDYTGLNCHCHRDRQFVPFTQLL